MATNRKKEKLVAQVKYQAREIQRKITLNKIPDLRWLQIILDTPIESLNITETARALIQIPGPSLKLSIYASVACSYLVACVSLLDAISMKRSTFSIKNILEGLQANTELKNSLTTLWEMLATYSITIHSSGITCEEIEFHHIQTLTWICLARLTFLLRGGRVLEEKKKQEDFRFIDEHVFGLHNPLPCAISPKPICHFGLKEIYTSCSILASSFRLASTNPKEINGISIDPSEVCEYIDALMCTYGSMLCFLPDPQQSPEEFKLIFNQAKFLDPMKQKPSQEFIEGMMAVMHPLYAEKLINELLRKNSASIRQGEPPSRAEFLSFFTWLIHLANSDMAKALKGEVIKMFPDAFVNSSHIAVYQAKNSIGRKIARQESKPAQVLLTMTPGLFDEILETFKSPLSSILKFYAKISSRENINEQRSITFINSMRIAAQHIIMELLNTAVKNVKAHSSLVSKLAMRGIRVIGGRKSSKRVSACGGPMGDFYSLIKNSVDTDNGNIMLVESLGRFYLIGLPGRAILEYKTHIDGLYGYFKNISDSSFGDVKKVVMSAFSRYVREEVDDDPEVVAYRNDILTLTDLLQDGEDIDDTLNSDTKVSKTSSNLPIHRLGDLCSVPLDTKEDKTSAYYHLKRYTSSIESQERGLSAAKPKIFTYG